MIISSNDPATSSPQARAAGAAGYLHKPVNKEELALIVAELLSQKKSNETPAAAPAAGTGIAAIPARIIS